MKTLTKLFSLTLIPLAFLSCAEKQKRTWIDPPPGYESAKRSGKSIYYQVTDVQTGKKETLAIPVEQAPQNLVVEDTRAKKAGPDGNLAEATKADHAIETGKLPTPVASGAATVSYLRGIQEVEDLYQKQQFNEALIRIQPLV